MRTLLRSARESGREAANGIAAFLSVGLLSLAVSTAVATAAPAALQAQVGGAAVGGQQIVFDSLRVEGNVRLSSSQILGTTTLLAGIPIGYQDIQQAIKDLWATGQFRDIVVTAEGGQDPLDPTVLTFQVDERDLLRSVEIRGLENVNPDQVRDTVDLQPNQPYSPTKVEEAIAFIRSELSSQGIPFARIDETREPVPDAEKEIRLVLDVTEGNRVTVAQVSIEGNEVFGDDEIIGALETKPEGFFWFRSGSYSEDTFAEDLVQRIPAFYRARGYLDVEVVRDTLIVDPQTGKARAEVTVSEGPRYRMAEFVVEGNNEFTEERLQQFYLDGGGGILRTLGFGAGEEESDAPVFNQTRFQDATTEVQRLYSNSGYLYAQVRPFVERMDSVGPDGDSRLRAGWEVVEGNQAYIDRVAIQGNDYTHERVIRDQITLLPGDIYSEDRLIQSYQSIQSLGFFVTPMELPDIQPDPQTGDVDITFTVEERSTSTFNFGTALSGGTGLSGFIGVDHPNLFGQAKVISVRWDFGRYVNSFTSTFSDPALFGSRISGSLSLFNARDRFFSFRSGERRRIGASTQFGIPLPGARFTRAFVGYSVSRTKYRLRQGATDTSLFGRDPGTQSAVSLGVARSTLNHPQFPTQGSRQRITFDFNGGPLGGDGDFVRQIMEGAWWVPVGTLGENESGVGGIRLALGLNMEAGAVYGDAENFPFDRFWLGGVQFGENLRGYQETSITPLGYFPENSGTIAAIDRLGDAYMKISAEYAIRLNDNISLSTFFDAGGIWSDPRAIDPGRLYRGAGVGVDLVTPFAPLGISYAYGFDKPEPGWEFHFTMGVEGF